MFKRLDKTLQNSDIMSNPINARKVIRGLEEEEVKDSIEIVAFPSDNRGQHVADILVDRDGVLNKTVENSAKVVGDVTKEQIELLEAFWRRPREQKPSTDGSESEKVTFQVRVIGAKSVDHFTLPRRSKIRKITQEITKKHKILVELRLTQDKDSGPIEPQKSLEEIGIVNDQQLFAFTVTQQQFVLASSGGTGEN